MNRNTFLACLQADIKGGRYQIASGAAIERKVSRLTVAELRALPAEKRATILLPHRALNRRALNDINVKSGGELRGIRRAPNPKPNTEPLTFRVSDKCAPVRPLYRVRPDALNGAVVIKATPEKAERLRRAVGVAPGHYTMQSESLERRLCRQRWAWWTGATVLQLTILTLYACDVIPTVGAIICLMLSTLFLTSLRSRFRC